jgi:hypothetical protein
VRARKGASAIALLKACILVHSEGLFYLVKVEKRREAGNWTTTIATNSVHISLKFAAALSSPCCHNSYPCTGCVYFVYVYRYDDVNLFMPVYVDDLLLASNSLEAIRKVKTDWLRTSSTMVKVPPTHPRY